MSETNNLYDIKEAYTALLDIKQNMNKNIIDIWFVDNKIDTSEMNEIDKYIYYIRETSKRVLVPGKYSNSTYKGELIKSIDLYCNGSFDIVTDKNVYTDFYIEYDSFDCVCADGILCDYQNRDYLNVSKY